MVNSDFLNESFLEPVDLQGMDFSGPDRFFNRELSWLAFNRRVLEEAENPDVPLLERVRFVSISASNLDEFFTVRVAGLQELARTGSQKTGADGLTPLQQLVLIERDARKLMNAQQEAWSVLRKELDANGITIASVEDLNTADRNFLDSLFMDKVFPVLTPLAIDPAHPFPFIPNEGFCLALQLERSSDKRSLKALLPIPQQIDRFVRLPDEKGEIIRFLPLEALLLEYVSHLFPGYVIKGNCAFRVLRDSDLEVEEEAEDLVREFETALKRRTRGEVVRLSLSSGAPPKLRTLIMESLGVKEEESFDFEG
ncbi:MAG: RNA degradosome polyphosphate kinase, partial [Albidovulum sp.]|nr:RNA degradosome polyphosphate kinase [Albidovulum sp.]